MKKKCFTRISTALGKFSHCTKTGSAIGHCINVQKFTLIGFVIWHYNYYLLNKEHVLLLQRGNINITNEIIYKSCGVDQKHYTYASLSMEVAWTCGFDTKFGIGKWGLKPPSQLLFYVDNMGK